MLDTSAPRVDPAALRKARERLDAHVKEIVRWHFSPDTGCPFWLERAKQMDFDPLKDVNGYADLHKFGEFEDEWLRGGPVRRWVPKAYADKPIYVFETGGTTGIPKSRIDVDDFRIDYEMFSLTLPDESTSQGIELAHARAPAARAGCGWRSSTSRSIAAASASASTSIRAGSSS